MKRAYSLLLAAAAFLTLQTEVSGQHTWDNVGLPLNLPVHALTADTSNEVVYAGGLFTLAGGSLAGNIAKWDGSGWSPVGGGILSGLGVTSMVMQGNELIVGGNFLNIGGVLTKNIARWNGSVWTAIGAGLEYTGVTTVATLTIYDGELYAGGTFSASGSVGVSNIAKWDGTNWQPLAAGTNGPVKAMCVYNGDLYVAGTFTSAGGVAVNNIAKWDGTSWSDVGGGVYYTGVTTVATLTVFEGELYVGGTFTVAGSVGVQHIAKWDGSNWSDVGGGASSYTGVTTVATLTVFDGVLVAGGKFNHLGTEPAGNIGKWDGSDWSGLGSGTNSSVTALAALGNKLYAGGTFLFAGSQLSPFIAQWRPSREAYIDGEEERGMADSEAITLYPNPVDNRIFTVNKQDTKGKTYTITVSDVTGRVVHCSELKDEIEFDRMQITPGLYIYKIAEGNVLIQQGKLSFR